MASRYEIIVKPPDSVALRYGIDYPLYVVWDRVRNRRVPFGNYRNRDLAVKRIQRLEAKP
ncbi:hypothetical protein [Streptomyces sp. NPDC055006]